jgi:hypothetical protein
MPLFGKKKTVSKTMTIDDELAELERELGPELKALAQQQGVIDDKLGREWGRKKSASEDEELERELEELMKQSGKARGGDRVAQLRAMVLNSIQMIKAIDKNPPTPESAEARKRLLETAKRLNAELARLKSGAKRKRTTRRKKARRSS